MLYYRNVKGWKSLEGKTNVLYAVSQGLLPVLHATRPLPEIRHYEMVLNNFLFAK